MERSQRYNTSHLIEDQYEPGSRGRVLRNKLNIKSIREMNRVEKDSQIKAIDRLTDLFAADHQFTAQDICKIHKVWLGDIYEWAGEYRQVKMSKDDFSFAFPEQIPKLMTWLENGPLRQYTPCTFISREEIIKALAIVHAELVIIHPFREGNGRAARMLAALMALQAGMSRNYEPMEKIFTTVVRRTLRFHGQQ